MKRALIVSFLLMFSLPAVAQEETGIPESPFGEEEAPRPRRPRPPRVRPAQEQEAAPRVRRPQPVAPEPAPEPPPAPEPVAPEPPVAPAPPPMMPDHPEEEAGWPPVEEEHRPTQEPTVAHTSEEEAEHATPHDEHHGPLAPNYTELAASALNFALWLALFVFLLRKPLTAFLTSRRRAVVEGLEEAARLKEAAEDKYAKYSDQLAHLDEELQKLRQEMIQAGESERDRIIAEAETRAARMRKDAQFVIEQQMKQLKADLTREAIEAAVSAAEEVLSRETTISDQERLAQEYLARIESSIKEGEVSA